MKRVMLVLSFLFLLTCVIASAQAQEALTQTFTAADGSYSLMYLAGWSAALGSDGVHIQIASGDKSVTGNIAFDSQTETAKELVNGFTKGSNVTDTNITVTEFQVNGLPAARSQFKAGQYTEEVIAVEFPNGKSLRIAVYEETPDAIANAGATLVAIASSFQVGHVAAPASGGAMALPQTFTASDGSYSFQYPADWFLTDYGAQGVSLYVSNDLGTLTGIVAVLPNPGGDPPDAWLSAQNLSGGQKATLVQISGRDAATVNSGLGEAYALPIPGGMFVMSLVAHEDILKKFEPTIMAVLATLQTTGAPASTLEANAVAAQPIASTETATEATAATSAVAHPVVNGMSMLVFPGIDGGYSDLFTSTPDGKNVKQLTQQQLHALLPVWSPDGTMIAYISDTSTSGTDAYDVFVIPSNGGTPRKVSSASSTERGSVAWSPDSKQLLFIAHRAQDSGSQIYKVNADGSSEQKLAIDAQVINDFTLDWSPDGQKIAFSAFLNGGSDYAVILANADGSNPTPIPNVQIAQTGEYFKWSPDGQHAVISDTKSLTVTASDGSAPMVIVPQSADLSTAGVSWSPDSTQIAFTASSADGNVFLYTINLDGSNQQKVDLGQQQVGWGGVSWGILPSGGSNAAPTAAPTTTASTSGSNASSACTITAAKGANLRSGPGTTFARAGALAAGASQSVIGQAKGSDGFVWWKLSDGSWVRSDLVQAGGDCTAAPTVSS